MVVRPLRFGAFPNYVAGMHASTGAYSVDYFADPRKLDAGRRVIDIPELGDGGSDIEARFVIVDPSLGEEDAAVFGAHALLDLCWPDPEGDEGDEPPAVTRIVMLGPSGVRYEFVPELESPHRTYDLSASWDSVRSQVSPSLASVVKSARAALGDDVEGRLHAHHRRRIWLALGPRDRGPETMSLARRCRATLALYAAAKNLPFWIEAWPRCLSPQRLFDEAFEIVREGTKPERLAPAVKLVWKDADDRSGGSNPVSILDAGLAISRAGAVLYEDEFFEPEDAARETRDPISEPDRYDAAFVASEAFARHGAKTNEERVSRRRDFFRYYLETALPNALAATILIK